MSPVVHGGVSAAELAWAQSRGIELVDLSANLNPYGPHPSVVEAARNAIVQRYPETNASSLRRAYAERHGLSPECVIAGNGSTELLYLLARVAHGPALIVAPTFGEYEAACHAANIEIVTVQPAPPSLQVELEVVLDAVRDRRPGIVFLCNPNNPTGQLWRTSAVRALAAALAPMHGLLLVDEAYLDFAYPCEDRSPAGGNILGLRSMTKLHAIPGLRLGFLVGDEPLISSVDVQQPSWAVSAPAAAAALQALTLGEWEIDCRQRIAETRSCMADSLGRAGVIVNSSSANFLLLDVGDAATFRSRMMRHGWVVRDCTSFGLPGHVRVAVPTSAQAARLIADIAACLR